MKFNNVLVWWLAWSVFFSATFVQLHHIEHIVEHEADTFHDVTVFHDDHEAHDIRYAHKSTQKAPLDSAIDQCDTCTQSSHINLFIDLSSSFKLFEQTGFDLTKALAPVNQLIKNNWSAIQPRAPPAFLIS